MLTILIIIGTYEMTVLNIDDGNDIIMNYHEIIIKLWW